MGARAEDPQRTQAGNVILLVTGERDWTDREQVWSELNDAVYPVTKFGIDPHIVVGDAAGADRFALEWAVYEKFQFTKHCADWNVHGRKAGPIRNGKMVQEVVRYPDPPCPPRDPEKLAIAFWSGRGARPSEVSGTLDCIAQCVSAGIPMRIVPRNK
jgi:hypothetical protein